VLNRKYSIIRNFLLIISFILLTSNTVVDRKEITPSKEIVVTQDNNTIQTPFLQNDFVGFKEALAFKESQGKYKAVNTLGYLGKYQFGKTTLERFNIYNTTDFLNNPELQERAFVALCSVNKWILRKDIKRSVGTKINGIIITESGILAAAHLSGAGNVKKYLRSGGAHNLRDAYGTSIQAYMEKFANYNVSEIVADRKARV